ncbi:MAG: 4Fe-4S binding protein [Bacillota bacterium]|nr:4Fe-4S binding protein [Bacillota bacterium]
MQWETEAEARLNKAPFFVRRKVKQQVEDYVRSQGRTLVTSEDITASKKAFFGGVASSSCVNKDKANNEGIPVSSEEIAKLEELVEKGLLMNGLESKYHSIKLCGGAAGCPLSVIDDKKVAQTMIDVVETTDLAADISCKLGSKPVLSHHKFKAAVAGCPNSCSEPQIKDFSIIGQRRPTVSTNTCSGCGLCIKACRENGLTLDNKTISINYESCLNCGLCIDACPREVLVADKIGYKIVVGGRLGRHPRLAETLVELVDQEQLFDIMTVCLDILKREGIAGERFSHLVERMGIEELRKRISAV